MKRSLLLFVILLAACGHSQGRDDLFGSLSVDITQVPIDVSCVTVTVSGASRQTTRLQQALAPGQSTLIFTFSGLPTGIVVASAVATATNCTGAATWISNPVTATIATGTSTNITLVLHRNGQANVTLDFQDDIKAVSTVAGIGGLSGSADGTGSAARFGFLQSGWSDGTGNIYLADSANCDVRRFNIATAVVTTVAGAAGTCGLLDGTGTAAHFQNPFGITGDASGNIYVADDTAIRKIAISSGFVVTTIAGGATSGSGVDGVGSAARFARVRGLASDGTNVYITDYVDCTIRQLVPSTAAVTTLAGAHGTCAIVDAAGTAARLNAPYGIVADTSGNLYFTDTTVIRKLNISSGSVVIIAGVSGVYASVDGAGQGATFYNAFGIAIDGTGNLWLTDNELVRKLYLPSATVVTVAGTVLAGYLDGPGPTAKFSGPSLLVWDNTQGSQIFVPEILNFTLRKLQ